MSMTPEERAVIAAAQRFITRETAERRTDLAVAVQRLKISRQPLHTVEPIPCMVYANNSATMFCILPKGHGSPVGPARGYHVGHPGGNPAAGRRLFRNRLYFESMETHERGACARFPGCTRHPKREAKS